jgi:hypothetical protein
VLKALKLRKSTFLSRQEWTSTPWLSNTKDKFQQFLDLAVVIPTSLEQVDSLLPLGKNEFSVKQQAIPIRDQLLEILSQLKRWEKSSGILLPIGPKYMASKWTSAGNWNLFTSQIRPHWYPSKSPQCIGTSFDCLQNARLMLLYWACTLTVYTCLYISNPLFVELNNTGETNLPPEGEYFPPGVDGSRSWNEYICVDADHMAENICEWVDLCSQNAWQSYGPAIAIFSLNTVIDWYQGSGKRRLLSVTADSQVEYCRGLLHHLTGAGTSMS